MLSILPCHLEKQLYVLLIHLLFPHLSVTKHRGAAAGQQEDMGSGGGGKTSGLRAQSHIVRFFVPLLFSSSLATFYGDVCVFE